MEKLVAFITIDRKSQSIINIFESDLLLDYVFLQPKESDFKIIKRLLSGEEVECEVPAKTYFSTLRKMGASISSIYFQTVNKERPICYVYISKGSFEEATRCSLSFGIMLSLISKCPFCVSEKVFEMYNKFTFSELKELVSFFSEYELLDEADLKLSMADAIESENYEAAEEIKKELQKRKNNY